MKVSTSIRLMCLLWKFGYVSTFTFFQFATNAASQYGAIVAGSASGNFSAIGPGVLLEPIVGLGISCRYIIAAQTVLDRRARAATLAAFFCSSAGAALTTDPATNAALGGAVGAKIAMMRAVLARGGGQALIKYFLMPFLKDFTIVSSPCQASLVDSLKLHTYNAKFSNQSRIIIQNLFAEHTARRYANSGAQKACVKVTSKAAVTKTVTKIIFDLTPLGCFVSWTIFGLASVSLVTIGGLMLFQRSERKRFNYVTQDFIETTARNLDN